MDNKLNRLAYLIGEDKIASLKDKRVMICGCGGVGSFVSEALARSGIGHIILVDFDIVDASNLNRQLMSDKTNIGKKKTEVLKKRLEAVSDAEIETIDSFIDEEFELPELDYLIDCIDTLNSKFSLAKKAHAKNIPFIASMGTARRLKIKNCVYTTLDKTSNDPLARKYRNLVKKEGYRKKIEVVYCDSDIEESKMKEEPFEKYPLGSAIFTVGSVGLKIANIVFLKLLGGKDEI